MAHQLVLVLIQDPHAKVMDQVHASIRKHSTNAKVPPYKVYFTPNAHWEGRQWPESDVEEFVRLWQEKIGERYEKDANGYFVWRDTNRDGHYDWATVGGRWNGIFAGPFHSGSAETDVIGNPVEGNICPVTLLPGDLYPGSIVTPDGEWHFFGWRFFGKEPDAPVIELIRELVKRYSGYYAVAVDAHL